MPELQKQSAKSKQSNKVALSWQRKARPTSEAIARLRDGSQTEQFTLAGWISLISHENARQQRYSLITRRIPWRISPAKTSLVATETLFSLSKTVTSRRN